MIFMFALNRAGGFQIIKKAFVEGRDVLPIPPSLRSISASCSKKIDKIPEDSFCRRQFGLLGLLFIGPGQVQGVGDDVPPGPGDQAAGGEEAGKWHVRQYHLNHL